MLVRPAGAAALVIMLLKPGDVSGVRAIYKDASGIDAAFPVVFALIPVAGMTYGIALRTSMSPSLV